MRVRTLAMALAMVVTAPSAGSAKAPPTVAIDTDRLPFQVTLPPGLHTEMLQGPDFRVYYFNRGEQTYAGAYLGFAPQFRGERPKTRNGVTQQVTCADGKPVERDALYFIGDNTHEDYIHAWTVRGTAQDNALAEAILLSIHVIGVNDGLTRDQLKGC